MSTVRPDPFNGVTTPLREPEEAELRYAPGETALSRFKMTELLIDGGRLRYGLWEPPDIEITGGEPTFTVPPELEHRPDLVSHRAYRTVDLWWAIMQVNNIFLPIRDLRAGTTLIIPFRSSIEAALQRARR